LIKENFKKENNKTIKKKKKKRVNREKTSCRLKTSSYIMKMKKKENKNKNDFLENILCF
jgi:hypothetical protein